MHKILASLTLSLVAFIFVLDAPADSPTGKVCDPLSTGRISVQNMTSVEITAPEGKLISGYCVKAGSSAQGLGPEYYRTVPIKTTLIQHSSGKDIGHYSARYVDAN